MANYLTAKRIPLLILIIIFLLTTFIITSEARVFHYGVVQSRDKNFDSQLFFLKLGYDSSKLEKYPRRSLITDRLAPAGPNAQHHLQPPSHQ